MRPRSIIYFERAFFALIAISLLNWVLGWDRAMEMLQASPELASLGPAYLIGAFVVSLIINLLLWFFAARRASAVAKWILVVLAGLNAATVGVQLLSGAIEADILGGLTLADTALFMLAVSFLFRPDAKLWFAGRWTGDYPDIFS